MKFSVTDNGKELSFTEAFLNEDKLLGKPLRAVDVPSLPKAFFNNIGEMSPSDVAFVIANQFFGQTIDSMIIKNITAEWLKAIDLSCNMEYSQAHILNMAMSLANMLTQFYIDSNVLSVKTYLVGCGNGVMANSFLNYLTFDKLLFSTTAFAGEIVRNENITPVVILRGHLEENTRLIAKSISHLKDDGLRSLVLLTSNSVAVLLTYVFILVDRARILSASGNFNKLCISNTTSNLMIEESIAITRKLGMEVDCVNDYDGKSDVVVFGTSKAKDSVNWKAKHRGCESFKIVAPTVPLIKQSILSYTT